MPVGQETLETRAVQETLETLGTMEQAAIAELVARRVILVRLETLETLAIMVRAVLVVRVDQVALVALLAVVINQGRCYIAVRQLLEQQLQVLLIPVVRVIQGLLVRVELVELVVVAVRQGHVCIHQTVLETSPFTTQAQLMVAVVDLVVVRAVRAILEMREVRELLVISERMVLARHLGILEALEMRGQVVMQARLERLGLLAIAAHRAILATQVHLLV